MISTALKLLCTATLTLGTVSVAHAQFGNLLKDLEKAAKELEKGIQQGTNPGQEPTQTSPESATTPGVKSPLCQQLDRAGELHFGFWKEGNPKDGRIAMELYKTYPQEIKTKLKDPKFRAAIEDRSMPTRLIESHQKQDPLYANLDFISNWYRLYALDKDGCPWGKSDEELRPIVDVLNTKVDLGQYGKRDVGNMLNTLAMRFKEPIAQEIVIINAREKQLAYEQSAEGKESREREFKVLNEKGIAFAKESQTKWKAVQAKDPMTGTITEWATAKISGGGVSAIAELRCEKDPEDKLNRDLIQIMVKVNNLRVPTTFNNGLQYAKGRISINGQVEGIQYQLEKSSIDRFHLGVNTIFGFRRGVSGKGGFLCRKNNYEIIAVCRQDQKTKVEEIEYVHSLMVSMQVREGELFAQIPTFDPAIRSVVKDCKGK